MTQISLTRTLWILYALFVVYATTIPFHFAIDRDILAVHLSQLSANPFAAPGRVHVSLLDDVQNIVLFVPFGMLGMLAAGQARVRWRRVLFVTALAACLTTSVEILQLFTRERISSSADVLNNTLGGLIGAVISIPATNLTRRIFRFLLHSGFIDSRASYPLIIATIGLCLAAWEPFDLEINLEAQIERLSRLRANLWQYAGLNDEGVAVMHTALFGVALCFWLSRRPRPDGAVRALALGIPLVLVLEASQMLIGTRLPSLEDALVRSAGVLLGGVVWVIGRRRSSSRTWLAFVVAGTAVGAAMQMLSPFELAAEQRPFQWLPFMNYYEVTTSVTLSHALELMLMYFPLGFCFGWQTRLVAWRLAATVIVVALAIAAPLEYFQGFIVGRYPDVTDPGLAALGAWLGAWAATRGARTFEQEVAHSTAGVT